MTGPQLAAEMHSAALPQYTPTVALIVYTASTLPTPKLYRPARGVTRPPGVLRVVGTDTPNDARQRVRISAPWRNIPTTDLAAIRRHGGKQVDRKGPRRRQWRCPLPP